jgi:protein TonB
MFEDSLFASAPLPQSRNRAPALISIGVQAALVALLLVIPILRPDVLPTAARQIALLPPPLVRPVPPPPPPTPVRVTTLAPSEAPMAPATQQPRLQRQAFITDARPVDTPALAFGTSGIPTGAPVSILDAGGPSSPNVVVAHSGTGSGTVDHGTLHISTGVMAGRLLAPIQPQYPPIARISHTEGSVVVQAIIAKDGRIESAHAVSGPPLLQPAALEAVRAARYRPYLLNGQPTEVETTITINFKLGS